MLPTNASLLVRVSDGSGKFPFRTVSFKKGQPVAVANATSYYMRYRENGKRKTIALGSDLEAAAREFFNQQLRWQSLAANPTLAVPGKKHKILDAYDYYVNDLDKRGIRATTLHRYRRAIDNFMESLRTQKRSDGAQHETIEEIDREDILNYMGWMKQNLRRHRVKGSANGERNLTLRIHLNDLAIFFNFENWQRKFPFPRKSWPKPMKKTPDSYSVEELRQLLSVATEDEKDLILFFRYTGFRDMEVAHACYTDIDFRKSEINVDHKPEWNFQVKDSEQRPIPVPLPGAFLERIKARRERYPKSKLIFPSITGGPKSDLLYDMKKIAARAKLETHVTLHKFRRTFASEMCRKYDLDTLRQMLGHSSLTTTALYLSKAIPNTQEHRAKLEEMSVALGD